MLTSFSFQFSNFEFFYTMLCFLLTGSCDQVIEKCTENKLPCEETYGSDREECPTGHEMVTMKSKCGKARDACAECSQLISSASLPAQTYDAKCYYDHELSILNSCKQNM